MATASTDGADTVTVLFDGQCGLCRGGVRFLLKRDFGNRLRFGAMQEPAGQALLRRYGRPTDDLSSFVVIDGGRAMLRSTAALHLARFMPWPWPLLRHFLWLPRPLRDALYDLIASTRFWFFHRYETCYVPTAAERQRFL
jgi:predicted DCC family thiol-disulfide oxidoreductase YuxK